MTPGETLFYLREIHAHWGTSNVSRDKLAELKAARLIEINGTSIVAVRLTSEGARIKSLGRPSSTNGQGISPRQNRKNRWQRSAKKAVTQPKPFV
jgi:hypothetical protein